MEKTIKIFDTTLRDGEQSPGCSMNIQEKLEFARNLERLNVDVIEAGFPVISKNDFKSVELIAKNIKNSTVTALARCTKEDIDAAFEAVKEAALPRLHLFIATSDIHMKGKLCMEPDDVYKKAVEMVSYAALLCDDIEFSAEDATRSSREFLYHIFEGVIEAGAKTINIPDTVGYFAPSEMYDLVKGIKRNVKNIEGVCVSVHCHNDLGLAVANSISALQAGAEQIHCSINGLGDRAGNAALEEIVMNLETRSDFYKTKTNIDTSKIYPISQLLSKMTGVYVQPNKAIVGKNAFVPQAVIHQYLAQKNTDTYQIMTAESIGIHQQNLILGRHSGIHEFEDHVTSLGYNFAEGKLKELYEAFKVVADKKKTVNGKDIIALINRKQLEVKETYKLDNFIITTGNTITSTATIEIIENNNQPIRGVALGNGPINALFKAIESIVGYNLKLEDYGIDSVTDGRDAQGEAYVKISYDGEVYHGRGVSLDILEASVLAYIDAVNQLVYYGDLNE